MIALKKLRQYPFDNPNLAWVHVDPCVWNRATIQPHESFIFVDKDVKEYLDDNNIVLEWSRFQKHIQSANIHTIGGLTPKQLRQRSKEPIKTLAEIITGTRGKRRGPKDSFHANDWTRAAFNHSAKKHTTDHYVNDIINNALTHDLVPPNLLFELPTTKKRYNTDIRLPIKKPDNEEITLPIKSYMSTDEFEDAITRCQNRLDKIFEPHRKPKTWKDKPGLIAGITLVMLLMLTWWIL